MGTEPSPPKFCRTLIRIPNGMTDVVHLCVCVYVATPHSFLSYKEGCMRMFICFDGCRFGKNSFGLAPT
jgi:hypothetical protein